MGLPQSQFFKSSASAPLSYVVINLFGAGSGMVLWVSAFRSVPVECYEAATLDGANPCRKFFAITLPLITPYLLYMLFTTFNGMLGDFGPYLYVGYDGGDGNALLFIGLYIYKQAYVKFNFGYAAALGWIQFAVTAVFSIGLFRSSKKWVNY